MERRYHDIERDGNIDLARIIGREALVYDLPEKRERYGVVRSARLDDDGEAHIVLLDWDLYEEVEVRAWCVTCSDIGDDHCWVRPVKPHPDWIK